MLSGDRIIGEVENIAPGLNGEFSLTLKAGDYTTACPGGAKHAKGKLTVTGTAATKLNAQQKAAVETYRAYLVDQSAQLVTATKAFTDAVDSGNVELAKQLYPAARVPYERIEPVAETFGDLDPDIDAREGDVPKKEWGGFHVIEQALWVDGSTSGLPSGLTAKLNEDVQLLANLVKDVEMQPASIANGSVELLNEVSSSKITGEEERYSRTDLVDFEANVQGSQAAFDSVKPLLTGAKNTALASQIDTRFATVTAALVAVPDRHHVRGLHRAHHGRHEGALAGDRLAGRAALEGREAGREHMSGAGAVSRRRFLGVAGAAGAGALVATATTLGTDVLAAPPAGASVLEGIVPFHGLHQAGIVTPAQDKLLMASFDVITNDKNEAGRRAPRVDARGAADDRGPPGRRRQHRSRRTARRHRRERGPRTPRRSRSRSASARRCSNATASTASGWRRSARKRSSTCRASRATRSSPPAAVATWWCRRAPTTRRSRSTPSAT